MNYMNYRSKVQRTNENKFILRITVEGSLVYESAPKSTEASAQREVYNFVLNGPNRGYLAKATARRAAAGTSMPTETIGTRSIFHGDDGLKLKGHDPRYFEQSAMRQKRNT